MNCLRHIALSSLLAASACGTTDGPSRQPCIGAKCDIPDGESGEQCSLRRRDAFNENQLAFTETGLRWSCLDVAGVTGIDKGQEYCEAFSVVALPPAEAGGEAPEPEVLGRLIRIEPEDPDDEDAYAEFEQTPLGVELTADQIYALEMDPTAIVGQCVFTSWNLDTDTAVPACDTEAGCPSVMGVDVDAENFQMKFDFNSADAAQLLTDDCLYESKEGDLHDPQDPLHDDFFRGCMLNADINQTQYRKSDSTICSAVNRLAECDCRLADDGDLALALSPFDRRGFPLGTWAGASELPAGCKYVELGDGSNTVVECELTAEDVLGSADDPKAVCNQRYAANVVVHVPINPSAITCSPSRSDSPYADTCTKMPWVLKDGSPNQQQY